ncbi:hypothetical protein G647_04816 [Cladophialophora carrionii CBS 160.54]|uniref:PABS domain-containing protein n=1 Tax=Cladophialophora carrionii CBS 160.54 TaxID=1279043 RepID=V9D841_9EURO|nr:uncharacterized protein G647_04816 [Cladophialophora carrionii CBS 160.54]ETI23020.1 hypothetical protein G647_04816 [Cladophialophora carrionii CBS 160.54]
MAKRSAKPGHESKDRRQTATETSIPDTQQRLPKTLERPRSIFATLGDSRVRTALQLVLLAALYAPVSQLNLSPVYGEIPSRHYHPYGLTASFLAAYLLRGHLPRRVSRVITPFCFWVPTIQFLLFRFSSTLGNPLGPVVTESLTCFPVVTMSIYVAMQSFDSVIGRSDSSLGEAAPSMGLFVLFSILHHAGKGFVSSAVGPGFLRSRIGMHLIVASLYGMVLPSSVLWPSLPAVAFTMVANPHCGLSRTTQVLNNTLALHHYTLLERKESITGYISVLEDNEKGFRVMRCDHSLLGGEWQMPPPKKGGVDRRVGEPIYSVFVMLEAVRLAEPAPRSPRKTALNVGLGVGTAPSALIQHGVDTTVMELDPVVHEFALKYFNFPHNHSHYIGDAVHAVTTANASEADSYDYIIHDVFTGGAEPVELFTPEFLAGLHMLLKPDGVIAINYAGDLAMPASSLIYRTVTSVFPSCRVFREDEAPAPGVRPDDFTNMVFFCRKQDIPVRFRKPVAADFLGSGARRAFLLPKHEIMPEEFVREGGILKHGHTKELEKWQAQSAIGHWRVMRTVLPDAVWENW